MNPTEQSELFSDDPSPETTPRKPQRNAPLAARMRPETIADMLGHVDTLGPESLLRQLVAQNDVSSLMLYGPPGCGKTTLARAIAQELGCCPVHINAVLSNVAELRDILKMARYREQQTLLFIDEIHRFNRAQQDLLLPDVEAGHILLIGATTHNPSFYIIPPLLSRSHLVRLEALDEASLVAILEKSLQDAANGLGHKQLQVETQVLEHIARFSNGDARQALNLLETLCATLPTGGVLSLDALESFFKTRHLRFDAREDDHYDTISAYIKSIRGNDPDAALYWLAIMLEGGEDPRFVARRLFILASEDVGLADPRALPLASACFHACEVLGMPECRINLAHTTSFLATCPKSNTAYMAYNKASQFVHTEPRQAVPPWLRDGHTQTSKRLGYSKDYRYSHNFPENVSGQDFMLEPQQFYTPKAVGAEASIEQRLQTWKALKQDLKKRSD